MVWVWISKENSSRSLIFKPRWHLPQAIVLTRFSENYIWTFLRFLVDLPMLSIWKSYIISFSSFVRRVGCPYFTSSGVTGTTHRLFTEGKILDCNPFISASSHVRRSTETIAETIKITKVYSYIWPEWR